MKREDIRPGMRVYRANTFLSRRQAKNMNTDWDYGHVINTPYESKLKKGLWKVHVKFDTGKILPVCISRLKEADNAKERN